MVQLMNVIFAIGKVHGAPQMALDCESGFGGLN